MKIGIVTTTIRDGRVGLQVANWVLEEANKRNDKDVTYELVDLKDYHLPLMGMGTENDMANINAWKTKMGEFDGFIFVTAEYNHSPSGVFKNALDYLKGELVEKVVAFVGYGGIGGGRSIEQLKLTLSTLSTATTGISVNLMLAVDFKNYSVFEPQPYQLPALDKLFTETYRWTKAFKQMREEA